MWHATQLLLDSCTHVTCYATVGGVGGLGMWRSLHVHTCDMLRNCSVTLAHMWHAGWHATHLLLDSCTHVTCYATVVWVLHTCDVPVGMLRNCCVTLAHMWHATQLLRDSCAHVTCRLTCYATVVWVLHTCDMPIDMLRKCCVTLAHMWHATQLSRDSCAHVTCRLTCYATVVCLLHTHVTCYANASKNLVGKLKTPHRPSMNKKKGWLTASVQSSEVPEPWQIPLFLIHHDFDWRNVWLPAYQSSVQELIDLKLLKNGQRFPEPTSYRWQVSEIEACPAAYSMEPGSA